MVNNGKDKSSKTDELLSLALQDFTPQQRSRALELALRLGIKPEDEFWLLFVSVGGIQTLIFDLQTLVSQAPEQWQELFFSFQGELSEWSDSNLQVLDSLILKAQNEDNLAKSLQQLIAALNNLTQFSQILTHELQTLARDSHNSSMQANSCFKDMAYQLNALQQQSDRNNQVLNSMNQKLGDKAASTRWFVWLVAAVGSVMFFFGWQLWQQSSDTNKRVSWILQRIIKVECSTGKKLKSSAECRGL
ncbi:hypothetical protein HW132_27895 [Brasilonema sp. CT11]|nr:hypothetical protein [Brasilonema sp. CT11]